MNIAHEGVYDFGTGTWEVDTDDRTEYVFPLEVTVPGLEEGGSPTIDDNGNEVYPSYDTPIMSGSSTLMMVPQNLAGSALMLEYTPNVSNLDLSKNTKLTKIPDNAFRSNTNLRTVTLPDTVEEIGWAAFEGVTGLASSNGFTSLTLSEKITGKIGDCAFYGCSGVTSAINLSEGITEIGYQAFRNCGSVPSFTLPSTLAAVGDHAFRVTSSNTAEFIIPETGFAAECPSGVTPRIGQYAFYYRAGLPSFPLPDYVTEIGDYAFSYCTQMTTISAIPSKLETLSTYAFRNCTAMTTDIVIPEAIDTIPTYAFYHCDSVTLVDMPSTLKRIDTYAFEYCSSLKTMIVRAEAPTFQDLPSVGSHGVDTQGSTNPVLYVPDDSYDNYNNTSSPFKSYVSSVKKLSDLATDFPGEYDESGNRL